MKYALILSAMLLIGCKTRERVVMVETTRTDTTYITKHQRDSIWLHDSIYVSEKQRGDTIFVESRKWLTKYIDRLTRDTLYIHVRDSVPVPYPVEVDVPAKLTRWQQLRMKMGDMFMCVLIGLVIFAILKIRR